MSTGELTGLPIAGLGIWYALARGRRVAGSAIALAGAAWTFIAVYVVVKQFSDEAIVDAVRSAMRLDIERLGVLQPLINQ